MMTHLSNQEIVLRFYKEVIGGRNAALLPQFIAAGYKQHSPQLEDGIAGLDKAIRYLATMPAAPPPKVSPHRMLLADGAFIVLLSAFDIGTAQQWVLDVFRLENGLIAEHWDAVQSRDPADIRLLSGSDNSVQRIFCDGTTMVSQSIVRQEGTAYAVYDIYTLSQSQVMQRLQVQQEIPAQLPPR